MTEKWLDIKKSVFVEDEDQDSFPTIKTNDEMIALLNKNGKTVPDWDLARVGAAQKRFAMIREPLIDTALHVITPVTRPQYLQKVADSIANADLPHNFSIHWHCIFKNHENRFNVIQLYNKLLDSIQDGWIHFMCDDNAFHPRLFVDFQEAIDENPNMGVFLVGIFGRKGQVSLPNPKYMLPYCIDAAQSFFKREVLGDIRYDTRKTSFADAKLIMDIYEKCPERFVFSDKILSYYERILRDDNGDLIDKGKWVTSNE